MATQKPSEHLEHELAVLLRRASAISAHLARQLHPDLEAGAYGLLLRLSQDEQARAGDLATFLGVGKPTVSRQLRALERLGLIERSRDHVDARVQIITLTSAGAARLERVTQTRRAHVRELLSSWDVEDMELFAHFLERFNGTLTQNLVDKTVEGGARSRAAG